MKKKSNVNLWIIGIILLLVFASGGYFFVRNTTIERNFNIDSISSPTISSTNPNLKDYDFIIHGSFGGGSSINGEVSVNRKDYTGTKPILFSASGITQDAIYTISRGERLLSRIDYRITKTKYFIGNPPACPEGYISLGIEFNNLRTQNVRHCMKYEYFGFEGTLNNPSVKFQATVTLSNGDEEIERKISSQNTVIKFDDIATMKTVGSLVTGDALPTMTDFKPINYKNGNWYFIDVDGYDDYKSLLVDYIGKTGDGLEELNQNKDSDSNLYNSIKSRVDRTNSQIANILGKEKATMTDGAYEGKSFYQIGGDWQNRNDFNNAQLKIPLETTFLKPTFTLYVRADWVGIELLSSQPKITSVSCPAFKTADNGVLTVKVKNTGSEAKFYTTISGCHPINQRYGAESESIYLSKGESGTVNVELETGNINADVTKTCTVRVYDSNDPDLDDTKTVTCKVEKVALCTEGTEYLNIGDSNCIDKCIDGEVSNRYACCPTGEKMTFVSTGKYACVKLPTGDQGGTPGIDVVGDDCTISVFGLYSFQNPVCEAKKKLNVIGIIIGVLVGLISTILLKKTFYDDGKKDWLNLILVIVGGLGLGFGTWYFIDTALDFLLSFWGVVTIILVIIVFAFLAKIKTILGLK